MSTTRKSINPPTEEGAAQTSAQRKGKTARGYVASLAYLFAAFTMLITDKARAFLMARLSVAAAQSLGMRASPTDVVDEFVRCLTVYAPFIQQKRLQGYGPMRARFGLELAKGAAPLLDRYHAADPALRGAAAERDRTMAKTEAMRAGVVTGLLNLAGDDAEANERVRAAAAPQDTADAHLRAMDNLAHEIAVAREEVPEELLDDSGLDAATLDAVQSSTRDAADARTKSRAHRLAQQQLRAELAEPCGRIYHELKTMLRAARTARQQDATIPEVTSWLVSRTATAAKPPTPPAPPSPA